MTPERPQLENSRCYDFLPSHAQTRMHTVYVVRPSNRVNFLGPPSPRVDSGFRLVRSAVLFPAPISQVWFLDEQTPYRYYPREGDPEDCTGALEDKAEAEGEYY